MKDRPALPAGYRLDVHDSLDSTNAEAGRQARAGAPDGTVIQARRQTAGRGRQGRVWESPEGNLYCSVILRPDVPPAAAAQLTFVTALALGEAIDDVRPTGTELAFKWPNDLLLDEHKLAGILLESSGSGNGRLDWLVIGCGLNIRHFPETASGYPATSLHAAGAEDLEPGALLAAFLHAFAVWHARWQDEGLAPVREAWLSRAARIGGEITVRLPRDELRGRFTGLDETGALLLDLPDGSRRTVTAGDVFF